MELLRDISIFWILFHALILFMLLYEPGFGKKKSWILTLAFMVPLCALNGLVAVLLGPTALGQLMFLTCTLPSLIFFYVMAKNRGSKFLFTFCMADTVIYDILILTALLEHWLGDGTYIVMFVSRLLICPLLEIAVWKWLRRPYLTMQNKTGTGWGIFAVVSILFYLLLVVMFAFPVSITERPDDILPMLLVAVIMPFVYLTMIRVVRDHQKFHDAQEQKHNAEKQLGILENELAVGKEYVNRAKQTRHDIRHGILVVLEYLEEGNVEGAKEYLAEYNASLSVHSLPVYCENRTVNAILRLNARKCKQENIAFSVQAVIPEALPYTNVETGNLFGNLLENAFEAARKCEDSFVRITSECRDGALFFEIQNSVSADVVFRGELPVSTKPGGGTGLRSVRDILTQHGGMMHMQQSDGRFTTQLIQKM